MTAETLHDALTLLPTDLIAEADAKRTVRRRVIPWKRYAAMAACFVLVACSGWFCMTHFVGMGGSMGTGEQAAAPAAMEAPRMESAEEAVLGIEDDTEAAESPAAQATRKEELCSVPTAPSRAENAAQDASADTTAGQPKEISRISGICTPRDKAGTACFTGEPRITLLKSRAELDVYLEHYNWQYNWDEFTDFCEAYDESWFENHDLLLLAIHGAAREECMVSDVTERDGIWEISLKSPVAENTALSDWHILVETDKGRIPGEDAVRLILE